MEEEIVLNTIKERLMNLNTSQSSIEETSKLILEECSTNPDFLPEIIYIWEELINSNNPTINRLAMLYLANDLLLRDFFNEGFPFRCNTFKEILLKSVPKYFTSFELKKDLSEMTLHWKEMKVFDDDFFYQLQISMKKHRQQQGIRETTLGNLIRSGTEVYIPNKIMGIIEKIDSFASKKEQTIKIKREYREGKVDKYRYLDALKDENSFRKIIINLFSKDIIQSKLIIHARHVKLLGEIDNLINTIENMKTSENINI